MAFSKSDKGAVRISVRLGSYYRENEFFDSDRFYREMFEALNEQYWVVCAYCREHMVEIDVVDECIDEFCKWLEEYIRGEMDTERVYNSVEVHITDDDKIEAEIQRYIDEFNIVVLEKSLDDYRKEEQAAAKSQPETKERPYSYPVKYSPVMVSYINELRRVTENLEQINELPQVFSKSLLISMDDGWGYSAFLRCIRNEFSPYYMGMEDRYEISEQKVEREKGIAAWNIFPKCIKEHNQNMEKKNLFSIVSFDMTDWMDMIENKELLNYIRRIRQYATRSICIFRFPYMDRKDIQVFERSLSTVASLRTLIIPPVSMENMVLYLKEKIYEKKFRITDGVEEVFEQWIGQVKNEGVFYGYKTLDKMASDLIYQKALLLTDGENMKKIVPEDVRRMLTDNLSDKDPYELLDELIGMESVKQKIKEIVVQVKAQQALVKQGKTIEPPTIHMMFLGNPGTGKTTVARILGKIYKKEQILEKGHFVEKQGSSFVQRYIGQSVTAMREACRDAYDNVLFIDEAYGMSMGHSNGKTSDETLPVLVAEMENHRDRMCVIFAGYSDEMKEFLKDNAGLESRIPHIIEFPNYSRDELIKILFFMIDGKFDYEPAFEAAIVDYIRKLPDEMLESKEFSNARFVRNLYEHLWGKAAYRASLSGETEITLKKEDVVSVIQEDGFDTLNTEKPRKIGFV